MKTIKFIFPAILTVLGQISFAQTGQWKLAGNSLSGAPKLGSTNSAALNFITNNKPRMTITPAGFVGIGTSAPDASLHVLKGSAGAVSGRFDAPLVVENSTNSYMNLLSPNANESGVLFGNPLSNVDGGIIYNNFANLGGLQFRTTSNFTRMVLTSAGNLGIGTLTPDATLHVFKGSAGNVSAFFDAPLVVENSTNSYMNLLSPGADESGVLFGNPQSNVDGGIIYNNQDNPGGLQFRTSGNNTSMTLSANGKLGVGANPGFFKLKVSQNDGFGLNIANTTDAVSDWELFTSNNLMLFGNGTFKGSFSQVDGTYSSFSDERLKTNIKPMLSVLEKINQLKPSTYQFKNSGDHQEHDGFIAQDIMKVFPALVTHNVNTKRNLDVYTLNYSGFGVIAVKAIQELQAIIQSQKSDIDEMKAMISELKTRMDQMSQRTSLTINASSQNNKAVELSGARLIQNAPNPFNTATVISYYLPEIKGSASIEVVSSNGQLLKIYPVTQKGNGQLLIKAGELASGTYNYVLIIDSKKVDSKQMVLVK